MTGDTATRERTFLLTDLQGSTQLHTDFPDDMLEAVERHDAVVWGAVEANEGAVFKGTGDGAFAVFDDPRRAVAAAVDIQRAMPGIQVGRIDGLVVRIGIDCGPARPRGDDYFGPALNTTARLEGAANGGQILVSGRVRSACEDLGTDLEFLDLGHHRFKGLDPIVVHQVVADGIGREFGPLAGKREADPGNLPASLSSFVGRRDQLAEIGDLVSGHRVVTLSGPGGMGKSRLALEAARACAPAFDDGAWLVELSPIEIGQDVWPAFTAALALPPVPGVTPKVQVLERLRGERVLLVIDNCEHVIDEAADAVLEIGRTCPSVVVIATSRRLLGLPGEALVEVPPLDDAPTDGGRSAAVELFVQRAQLASRRFAPDSDDLATIEAICRSLDHLPLAIEMAAANTRRLDLARILDQAAQPIDLRPARHRRAIGRQQTIRETLEWSYELLDADAGHLLDHLAVFAGPFDEDLAIDLCESAGIDEDAVIDGIDELLDASLLARDHRDDTRFRLLHLVRAFGRERLDASGRADDLERLHGETFARRVADLGRRFDEGEEREAGRVLFAEQPDLEAAFERALRRDADLAARLTAPLFFFTYVHRGSIISAWPARILEVTADVTDAAVLCAMAAAHSLHADADPGAAAAHLDLGRGIDPDGRASAGWLDSVAGQLAFWSGEAERSVDLHRRAIELAVAEENPDCAIISASLGAFGAGRAHDREGAGELLRMAESLAAESSSPTPIGYVSFTKGILLAGRRPELALRELQTSLEWAEVSDNPQGANRVARVMADIRSDHAPADEALEIRANALVNFPSEGDALHAWNTVQSLLPPLAELERYEDVALLAGAVGGSPLQGDDAIDRTVLDVRTRLGDDAFDELAAEGREWGLAGARRHVAEHYATH